MTLIPGAYIPVTGFIGPSNDSDVYPVTDAIYGIDGLRNVADHTERDNISIERRRAGMVVGTLNDGKYWRLKNQSWTIGDPNDWELFLQIGASGSVISTGIKYIVDATDDIVVPVNTQYWVYGDLTMIGQMTNNGEVVIANGNLVLSGGTFSNLGSLIFISLDPTFINTQTIAFTQSGSLLSANVVPGSLTASHLNSTGGATAGYLLSSNNDGIFNWVDINVIVPKVKMTIDDKSLISMSTSYDGQFSGATISNTPIDGCYVSVYINGQEFDVSNGLTMSSSCYFSRNGGLSASGFYSTHPNGQIQSGDMLYWNGSIAGTQLSDGWRISLHYLI